MNQDIIIYNTKDGKASVSLMAKDGNVWMNQTQLAELLTPLNKIAIGFRARSKRRGVGRMFCTET